MPDRNDPSWGLSAAALTLVVAESSSHNRALDFAWEGGSLLTDREVMGGHDPHNWEATLPEALVALIGKPASPH